MWVRCTLPACQHGHQKKILKLAAEQGQRSVLKRASAQQAYGKGWGRC